MRKEVNLGDDIIAKLEKKAKKEKRKLKPYMEIVLTEHANEKSNQNKQYHEKHP